MKITSPHDLMSEEERELALTEVSKFMARIDVRALELGSPHITEHRRALLLDYARGILPLASTCKLLLEMLRAFALTHFEDREFFAWIVCPTVARRVWFDEGTCSRHEFRPFFKQEA